VKHPPRPLRYNGAVAFYKVGGIVPETHKELTSSRLLTRPRGVINPFYKKIKDGAARIVSGFRFFP
jgi:hypothetical protein